MLFGFILIISLINFQDQYPLSVMYHESFIIPSSSRLSLVLLGENHSFLQSIFRSLDPALALYLYLFFILCYVINIFLYLHIFIFISINIY